MTSDKKPSGKTEDKICKCGDHTPNPDGVCWVCASLEPTDANTMKLIIKQERVARASEREKVLDEIEKWLQTKIKEFSRRYGSPYPITTLEQVIDDFNKKFRGDKNE